MQSFCSYYNRDQCRSCACICEDYSAQIHRKESKIRDALSFLTPQLERSFLSPTRGFRNRAKWIVTGTLEKPIIGLMGEQNLDEGRELLDCPIHHGKLNEVIRVMPQWIREFDLVPYQIVKKKGELKNLIAFYSPLSDQMYLRFILRSKESIVRIRKLIPIIQEKFPFVVCVTANLQPIPHAILEGPEEIFLTERDSIHHEIGGIRFTLSPQAFVQTNAAVASELYATAARWIGEARSKKMLELYCGQGAFSFFAAESAEEILGLEIHRRAVDAANVTAKRLGLSHLKFVCADATQVNAEMENFKPDLILVNPPRRGVGEAMNFIQKFEPKEILYSSCAIETLSEDLKKLPGHYKLRKVQLFDMFPHTEHFETLVWLTKT